MSEKKIPLDFTNYPYLWELFNEDKAKFATLVKSLLVSADKAQARRVPHLLEESFDITYADFIEQVINAFLDYKGILKYHPNAQEAKSMEILEHDNNPLVLFKDSPAFNLKGEEIPSNDFLGALDIKDWMQGLLYASRYVPFSELAKYLYLNEFDMLDQLKLQNVEKLLKIQPSLNYQKENGLTIGKRVKGTAYFDLGDYNSHADVLTIGLETIKYDGRIYVPAILGSFKA